MSAQGFSFNPNGVEPDNSYDLLPPGWYNVAVIDAEWKSTSSGTGNYLELTMNVLDGPSSQRKLWGRFNLVNASQEAVRIAQRQLAAICQAVGFTQELNMTTVQQLFNRPLQAKVAIENKDDGYEPKNIIKGYKAVGAGNAPGVTHQGGFMGTRSQQQQPAPPNQAAQAPQAAPAAPAAGSGGSFAPWRR